MVSAFRTGSIFSKIMELVARGIPESKARHIATRTKRLRVSRCGERHQGEREMARRRRQMANGTHGL